MDFTLSIYSFLLSELQSRGYKYLSFNEYLNSRNSGLDNNSIILRHDVDMLPQNALTMALLEYELGIRGTYYFRIKPESFHSAVIEIIAELGHEIGYHYEDVDLVVKGQKTNVKREKANGKRQVSEVIGDRLKVIGDRSQVMGCCARLTNNHQPLTDLIDRAMESFLKNLETIRKIADIKTICMHGSPMSPYDNRLLWTKYDYRDYGIIGEPYFDVDFSRVAYYTDTGRRWDGDRVSVRDKVSSSTQLVSNKELAKNPSDITNIETETRNLPVRRRFGGKHETSTQHPSSNNNFPRFRNTSEIITAIENGSFPEKAMITIHPQRWHDRTMPWVRELVFQNIKNVAKRFVVIRQKRRKSVLE